MKSLLTALLALLCLGASAQSEYKASNGITYHVGDTVRIGTGSSVDGWFKYILPSALNTSDTQRDWFKRKFTNTGLIIKSINEKNINGISRYRFKMGSKAMYNVFIDIEEAIASCEVTPCTIKTGSSVADELKKFKSLLDAGAISQAEYESQKKKLLN